MARRARTICPLVGLLLLGATTGAPAQSWRPIASMEVGVDSYAQIYRLTDFASESLLATESSLRDTTDSITEMRVAGELGLLREGGRWKSRIVGRLSAGTDLTSGRFDSELDYRDADLRFDLDLQADARRFSDDTDFALSSDNAELRWNAHAQRRLVGEWWSGFRVRGDLLRYDTAGRYERNGQRVDVSATSRWYRGFWDSFDIEVGGGHRSVPDSSEISYDRGFLRSEWSSGIDERWSATMRGSLERRVYDDSTVRSPFWNPVIEPELRVRIRDGHELVWSMPLEWLDYDESSDVYFDLFLGRTSLAYLRRQDRLQWSVEPRWSWLRAPVLVEDEYVQPSLLGRVDWFGGDRLWFSWSEELGHRDYREVETDGIGLYSDYWFIRTTILASFRIAEGLSLEAFLSDEPESHRRPEDDARLTLATLTLRWRR